MGRHSTNVHASGTAKQSKRECSALNFFNCFERGQSLGGVMLVAMVTKLVTNVTNIQIHDRIDE
jgi:hypothetical protein